MAQSPYLEYIPWISYPVPRSIHTILVEPIPTILPVLVLIDTPGRVQFIGVSGLLVVGNIVTIGEELPS